MFKKILAVLVMLYAAVAMAAVDVNKASDADLDGVKGIGPVTSKLIMSERKKGEFKDWQDFIDRVKGIGDARAAKLSAEGLTVNGSTYKAMATKSTAKDAKADGKSAKEAKSDTKSAAKDAKEDTKATAKNAKEDTKAAAKEAKPAASAKK